MKAKLIVAVALLALAASAVSSGKKKEAAPAAPPLSTIFPDANAYIDAHNAIRAAVQKPKDYPQEWAPIGHLAWSDEIAATSQQWAEHLRDTRKCGLEHSDTRYGENLAGGQGMDAAQAVKLWASEIGNFVYTPVYDFQRNSGHYSQVIWRKTTHVGCGRATCGRKAVVVCRYDPPGNHIGKPPY
jgi:uncharacterized protein YkwD